ncbi:MAG TPA: ABC transporter permease [Rhodopila sp.]
MTDATEIRPGAGPLLRLMRNPMGVMGALLVVLTCATAAFAPLIATHDPLAIDVMARFQPPGVPHLLGTDQLGRDTFSRMVMGSRVALQVALPSVLISLVLGMVLGMIAGYGPRWLDTAISFCFDLLRSFPTVMLALSMVALFGPSLNTVLAVVVVTSIPIYGRVARTQTLALRSAEFITAEQGMGAGLWRIIAVHVAPNIMGPLLVLASMDIPSVIALEAGLSFLGMGVQPPAPSWGALLKDGYAMIRSTPWLVIAGAIPIIVTTLGFTFLGEALRDLTDPRRRSR